MSLKLTVLGCGNSAGVPAIGNFWGSCDPNEPRNRRHRCSLAVQSGTSTVIIDTGADLRHQINEQNISYIDGVFYTHDHSDHTHGIDDLRPFFFRNNRTSIPCYGSSETIKGIKKRFDFMFKGGNHTHFYPIILTAHEYNSEAYGQVQKFKDIEFVPFVIDHGTCKATGYRFGDVSYCVDMKSMDQTALDTVKGSKVWIVDGSGHNNPKNDVHADLKTLYEYNKYIQAETVYVTCLSPFMDYEALKAELPEGFYPAYDGLVIEEG